ncbi:MAG: 30S ribosome-binding factor RbfA [Bacteroidales bacterium]|nr:30S ribosome-binding factor RbfA [Bacteroidales bacterium]MBR5028962.1 30S ribosome-binding factor RbfA [Bacteroidales bacterium]
METTRQQKISRLLQQEMGNIFQQETKSIFGTSMITVTEVRISPDLSVAKVWVSIYPLGGAKKEDVMTAIQDNTSDLRRRLGLRVGKQLRIIPQLTFFLDDSLDYIENIDRLLKQ